MLLISSSVYVVLQNKYVDIMIQNQNSVKESLKL